MIDKYLFFCISDGEKYEKMTYNLFRSLKYFNPKINTACFCRNKINNSNINLILSEYTNESNYNLNTFNLGENEIGNSDHVAYSFKIKLISLIPKTIVSDYEKIIYLDTDAECFDEITIDESIQNSKFYASWCQSIVTQNEKINNKINNNWIWNNKYFYQWQNFAKYYKIKEWKNVNGGMFAINTNYIEETKSKFVKWNMCIKSFFGTSLSHNDELVMSLIQAEEGYTTPDISRNKICQLNMNENIEKIRQTKKFKYYPWFFSNEEEFPINVNATCVHNPHIK